MSDAFARRWFGLRFVDGATERAYREWARAEAVPFVRMGMVGSLLCWGLAVPGTYFAAPGVSAQMVTWLYVVIPAIVLTLVLTWFPKLYRGLHPLTAFANATAGLAVATPTLAAGIQFVAIGVAGIVVIGYFAFTIFRMPLLWAVASVAAYFGYFVVNMLAAPVELIPSELRLLLLTVLATRPHPEA